MAENVHKLHWVNIDIASKTKEYRQSYLCKYTWGLLLAFENIKCLCKYAHINNGYVAISCQLL